MPETEKQSWVQEFIVNFIKIGTPLDIATTHKAHHVAGYQD